ncbi:MAG: hypothetical protein AAFP16_10135 [Pseudomonadota bacterium]
MRIALPLMLLAGPALAGPVDFGPEFIGRLIAIGAFYLLYLIVPVVAYLAWRRGLRVVSMGLAALWVSGAVLVPLIDYMQARQQAQNGWAMRVMPDTLPIDGMAFLSDDTVRTPDSALNMFNKPRALYGMYGRAATVEALLQGPVDLGDFRYFRHVHRPGVYKDRDTVEVPPDTRIDPDFIMLSRFWGDGRRVLQAMQHPAGAVFAPEFGARFAILEVADPAAFDLRTARVVMLVPYASASYHPPPYNPFVRDLYRAATYREEMALLMRYFCADVSEDRRDRCRREI